MVKRYKEGGLFLTNRSSLFFSAIRQRFKEGYSFKDFGADILSGAVVALIAIPLSMALAIATGVAPQHGLYTAIVAGLLVPLLGGSRFQVTGPTAAFVVILAPIVVKFGLEGLLVAGLMAGVMLVCMGFAGLGQIISFIPYPVTTGFTSGIALVIGVIQLKDFFGLTLTRTPESFIDRLYALYEARGSVHVFDFVVGLVTLLILIVWPKINRKIPSPLVALGIVSVGAVYASQFISGFEVSTIGNRFTYILDGVTGKGIPQTLPSFNWPWLVGTSHFVLNLETIRHLLPSAFAIALLGAIESLLSAVVADGLAQTRHNPNAELMAIGFGNIFCPFFGGIAATGAISRTATNIRFGAQSPLSSAIHAIFYFARASIFKSVA